MTIPLEIHFHGLDRSEAMEERVREKFAKLERQFDQMTSCRVVLEAPHRNAEKAKDFVVKIEIGVRGGKPIVVGLEREGARAHDDLAVAVRDAFDIARRRVDERSGRSSTKARVEQNRRRPRNETDETDEAE